MADHLHPDRLFPPDAPALGLTRDLHGGIAELPIISPHGHTDPAWFARNENFPDAASLFLTPDHYVLRMLRSRGITYEALGLARKGETPRVSGIAAWKLFAAMPERHRNCGSITPSSGPSASTRF